MSEWHGTSGGYTNHKCRCDLCRLAWNKYCREMRARRGRRFLVEAGEGDHGKEKTYQRGCSCPKCKSAHARYSYQLRKGDKSSDGVCDICRKESRVLWDHDHASGEHRGWLCQNCNQALGLVNDSVETLLRMEKYVWN